MKFNKYIFVLIATCIVGCYWFLIDNTYDLGDSITHYGISCYSWQQPYMLFDNWGKPVFTILSSPFAQLGWKGITFFNSLVGIITSCLIAQIIIKLKWNITPYSALLLFFIPNYPLSLNSGLTEPLYALTVVLGVYLVIREKYIWCAVVLSFLPFVRSEGFITITVFAIIFLLSKQWKLLPFFFTGFLVITILGFVFCYDKLFWILNTNPYTKDYGFNNYGSGNWSDYFIKYYYLTGIPFTALFWISVMAMIAVGVKRFKGNFNDIRTEFLLLGVFFSFFCAHIVFWKFGLFRSFGMSRVLISVLPIGFIIALYLFNLVSIFYRRSTVLLTAFAVCMVVFPFVNNKSSWNLPQDFIIDPEAQAMKEIKTQFNIDSLHPDKIYYSSAPLMILMDHNIYDTLKYKQVEALKNKKLFQERLVVVKDDWFFKTESSIVNDKNLFDTMRKVYSKKVSPNNVVEIYTNIE